MSVGSRPLVPSRLAPGGVAHGTRRTATTTVGAYVALTKPRIIELLLITTVPTMVLAEGGWPSTWLVIITLIGGTLAAGGANAINMYVDRDIDSLMERTRNRPLVTGVIAPRNALVFAWRSRCWRSPCCGPVPTCCRPCWRCRRRRSTSGCTPSG
jgi:heme o synthase